MMERCNRTLATASLLALVLAAGGTARAAENEAPQAKAPDKLVILFDEGSAAITGGGRATLDEASHLYRVGNPIVMIVTGSTDSVGDAAQNLTLSERRARVVLDGLVARGIPVQKLQLLAAGETEATSSGGGGAPQPAERNAVITWR